MRRVIALVSLVVAVAAGAALLPSWQMATAAAQQPVAIRIVDFGYQPTSVTVPIGTTVTWTNTGSARHTVTAQSGAWDSGVLQSGGTFSFRFANAGTIAFQCQIHPQMQGTVIVQAAGAAPAPAQPTAAPTPPPPTRTATPPPPTATPAPTAAPTAAATPAPTQAAAANAVRIVDFAFNNNAITVPVGTTVTWTHSGNAPHTVTSRTNAFDSGRLQGGQTFSFTFNQPGAFEYRCEIHTSMTGTVTVQGGGGAAPAQPAATPTRTPTPPPTAAAAGAAVGGAGGGSVRIVDFGFEPANLTVSTGTTVMWTSAGSAPHTVTGDGFDSGRLSTGQSFTVTFNQPGTFAYRCDIHPGRMTGTITVQGAPAGGGAALSAASSSGKDSGAKLVLIAVAAAVVAVGAISAGAYVFLGRRPA